MVMRFLLILFAVAAIQLGLEPADAATKETVAARGWLASGINQGLPGFSSPDAKGQWTGFDVDFCRAVAAAWTTPIPATPRANPYRQ